MRIYSLATNHVVWTAITNNEQKLTNNGCHKTQTRPSNILGNHKFDHQDHLRPVAKLLKTNTVNEISNRITSNWAPIPPIVLDADGCVQNKLHDVLESELVLVCVPLGMFGWYHLLFNFVAKNSGAHLEYLYIYKNRHTNCVPAGCSLIGNWLSLALCCPHETWPQTANGGWPKRALSKVISILFCQCRLCGAECLSGVALVPICWLQ